MSIRIGLIGAGANTVAQHIPGFRRIPGVELVGVVNRTPESSRRIADQFGIPRVFETPEALCADPEIAAVCIGTWPYKHRDYTVMALEAGKHVLCEARMACDLEEARAMYEAHLRHPGLVAQLVPAPFDFRLGPTITRLIAEGALGEVREVTVRLLNGQALDPGAPLHWRQRRDYSGRNVMMFGIYVEIIERWLGRHAGSVSADGAIVIPERFDPETGTMQPVTVPDTYVVSGELARGARITYHFSSVAGGAEANGIAIHGTKAVLRWRPGDTAELHVFGQPHPHAIEPDPGTDRGWRVEEDFIASIREGAPVRLTSFEDGLAYMRVVDTAHRSWEEGRRLPLPE
ncbi:Gfo/Idh/MocA family oxidoreductase [Tepidiforma sp.]|uniref:Gfo/Idh/MocA family protein n=1 Tax=Tepidiforma sp. TaxID=2682230 RepID=UPI002ADE19C7|nr:Gfo/Idh/MocA family oxidoreductase [Tepidiforma sp.]